MRLPHVMLLREAIGAKRGHAQSTRPKDMQSHYRPRWSVDLGVSKVEKEPPHGYCGPERQNDGRYIDQPVRQARSSAQLGQALGNFDEAAQKYERYCPLPNWYPGPSRGKQHGECDERQPVTHRIRRDNVLQSPGHHGHEDYD